MYLIAALSIVIQGKRIWKKNNPSLREKIFPF